MKKKMITILALVLVIATAVLVCTSCAKKEAKEETAKMSFTIINKTGATVKNITIKEKIGTQNQVVETKELADGQEVTMTFNTVVENEAPDLELSCAAENGDTFITTIIEKGDKVITLNKDADGGITADIITK